jgi:hypothetical protein
MPRCILEINFFFVEASKKWQSHSQFPNGTCCLDFSIDTVCYLTGLSLHSLTDINAGEQVELTCDVNSSENPSLCLTSATFSGSVQVGSENGGLEFPWPVLMRPGIFFTTKVTYKHITKRPTAVFNNSNKFTWDDSQPKEKFTVSFVGIKNIIDICGLAVARKIV